MKMIIAKSWKVIKEDSRPILYLVFISLLLLLPYSVSFPFQIHEQMVVLSAGLFLLGILTRRLFVVISALILVLTVIQLHLVHHLGSDHLYWLDSRIEIFFDSPPGEIFEYLQSHLSTFDIAIVIFALIFVFFLARVSRLRFGRRNHLRKLAILAAAAWSGLFVFGEVYDVRGYFPPFVLSKTFFTVKARHELLVMRKKALQDHPLLTAKCNQRYDRIVIIVGESMVTDHLGVYGYDRNTTPFIQNSDPLTIAAISPSNLTRLALPMMLTDAEPGNFDIFYAIPSIVSELRACGYRTYWISNQLKVGEDDSIVTSLADETDTQIFLNEEIYWRPKHDGEIIQKLRQVGIPYQKNLVTFVHLNGSHFLYENRYPKGFGFNEVNGTIDAYDNSILYTDFVLSKIHEDFYSNKTLILYFSDHGEVVSNGIYGHGFSPGYKEEYRIPILAWSEDKERLNAISSSLGGKQMNASSIPNMIRFLVGMDSELSLSTSDVILVLGTKQKNIKRYSELESFDFGN